MEAERPCREARAIAAVIAPVTLWLAAAAFCARWLGLLSAGELTFGPDGGRATLITLWRTIPILALLEIGLAVQSVRGKLPLRWHAYMTVFGLVALLIVVGD